MGEVRCNFCVKGIGPFPRRCRSSGEPASDRRACTKRMWKCAFHLGLGLGSNGLMDCKSSKSEENPLIHHLHLIPSMNLLNSAHTKWVSKCPAKGLRLSREPHKVNVYITVI